MVYQYAGWAIFYTGRIPDFHLVLDLGDGGTGE